MNVNFKRALVGAGLIALAAVPFIAKADVGFGIDINSDNDSHYHFHGNGWHHPEMNKAAMSLSNAKRHLWYTKGDFGGHRENAMRDINMALDEISAAENYAHSH